MRWAGWLAGLMFGISVACGGSARQASPPDGGSSGSTVPDDGGPGPDGGTAPECAGLVPASTGPAFAFDVLAVDSGETCDSSAVDGPGVVAAAARAASGTTWYEFAPNYGARSGNFGSPGEVFAQARGFIGLWGSSPINVALFSQGGELLYPSPVGDGPVVLGPASGGGVVSLSATPTALTVRKHDATAAEVASTTIPGAFVPLAAAEDATGPVLVVVAGTGGADAFWVDLAPGSAGARFPAGAGAAVRARPLLGGGVAIRLDGRWAGVAEPGESGLRAPPAWLGSGDDFGPALSQRAYAVTPGSGGNVAIVSSQGNACGAVTFAGVGAVSVGVDGTVVGSAGSRGCTKLVWRNALR